MARECKRRDRPTKKKIENTHRQRQTLTKFSFNDLLRLTTLVFRSWQSISYEPTNTPPTTKPPPYTNTYVYININIEPGEMRVDEQKEKTRWIANHLIISLVMCYQTSLHKRAPCQKKECGRELSGCAGTGGGEPGYCGRNMKFNHFYGVSALGEINGKCSSSS